MLGRRAELGNRLDPGLGLSQRLALGPGVDAGGGLVFGIQTAISLGPLLGQGSDHSRDGPVFKVGWRVDARRKVLDDAADVAVLVEDLWQ